MQHQEFEPSEDLTDTIKCFWYNRRDSGKEYSDFEVQPDGYAELIFHFGGDCSILSDGVLQALPSPFMVGLLNKPILFYARNTLQIIGIRCYPWTVFDLLGLPSGKEELRIFEHPVARLQPLLNELVLAGRIDEAINQVQDDLMTARSGTARDSMLFKAGVAMKKANGTMLVSQVAMAAHVTVRTLERNFKESTGHTVKDVSGLIRFEQVRNRLWLDPGCSLAGLAHELGYSDQSHLNREFKRYSGVTPGTFARNTKRAKRTFTTDFVGFIQS